MVGCGGKCFVLIKEESIIPEMSHAMFQAVTESLQYLLLHHKSVRWQTASPGGDGHRYDQNNLG